MENLSKASEAQPDENQPTKPLVQRRKHGHVPRQVWAHLQANSLRYDDFLVLINTKTYNREELNAAITLCKMRGFPIGLIYSGAQDAEGRFGSGDSYGHVLWEKTAGYTDYFYSKENENVTDDATPSEDDDERAFE